MFDARDASAIPALSAQVVAGYLDNSAPWSAADWALFPGAVHAGIATRAATDGWHIIDFEEYVPGRWTMTPAECAAALRRRRIAFPEAAVYCNRDGQARLRAELGGAFDPRWALCDIDRGVFVLDEPNTIGQQFDWGRNVDVWVVSADWCAAVAGGAEPRLSVADLARVAEHIILAGHPSDPGGVVIEPEPPGGGWRHYGLSLRP